MPSRSHRKTQAVRGKCGGQTARTAGEEGWGTLSPRLGLELALSGSSNSHRVIDTYTPTFANEEGREACESLTFCSQPVVRDYWSQDLNPICDAKSIFSLVH